MTLLCCSTTDWYVDDMQPTSPTVVRDFSGRNREITFTADGDTFYGVPRVATKLLASVVSAVNNAKGDLDAQIEAVAKFFDVCLVDESAALVRTRLGDKANPLDIAQALDIVAYLTEEYADRPTQPSQLSSSGSATEDTGTSSTVGAASEVSIPTTSPSIGS